MSVTNVGWEGLLAIIFLGLYIFLVRKTGLYKSKPSTLASASSSPITSSLIPIISQKPEIEKEMTLPYNNEDFLRFENVEPMEMDNLEIMDQDNDNLLLKEAEKVVDKIQNVINNTSIPPSTAEEVQTKIKNIVIPYQIFHGTEYYGAINTYIALSLERDLGMTLPPNIIESLWN
jgi:hypothetical protein